MSHETLTATTDTFELHEPAGDIFYSKDELQEACQKALDDGVVTIEKTEDVLADITPRIKLDASELDMTQLDESEKKYGIHG